VRAPQWRVRSELWTRTNRGPRFNLTGVVFGVVAATRRLAAIMFTDMVGSTASAQANEGEALRTRDEQADLVRPLFATHKGREIKSLGDGFLVEFDSALRAVQCAIDIQQHLHERNSQPGLAPILLRIGVHLGDVEQRDSDIFGDAVNIASRIEPLAAPGGVCLSGEVFSQIRNKIPNRMEKLPATTMKGMQVPIDLYRVLLPWIDRERPSDESGPTGIAVLPLINISPDPNDAYLADGMTEELITVLSQNPELLVIARTSVAPFKSTTKGVSQIGSELGVSQVLEGSVRRAGNQLRVTVQLIDVATQGHTWAKNYDRLLDDVFALQSEIAEQVAQNLRVQLGSARGGRTRPRGPVRPESYLAYLKGRSLMHLGGAVNYREAKRLFEKAITLDDRNAAAYAGLADVTRVIGWFHQATESTREEWDHAARAAAARAVELEPDLAEAHTALGLIHWDDFQWEAAERELRIALATSPSDAWARGNLATILEDQGRVEEALREYELTVEADPLSPRWLYFQSLLLIWTGRWEEATSKINRIKVLEPQSSWCYLAASEACVQRRDLASLRKLDDERLVIEPRLRTAVEAWHAVLRGDDEPARRLIRELEAEAGPGGKESASDIAQLYALLGDLDQCFHWLNIAVDRFDLPFQAWRNDPMLESARSDPRFQEILRRQNLS
jgi:adenylate cyclase